MATDYVGTIVYDATKAGKARLDFGDTELPIELEPNDTLTISVGTNFPNEKSAKNPNGDSYQIVTSNFWNSDHGNKGSTPKGGWKRDTTPPLPTAPDGLDIEASGSGVKFTDNTPNVREDYYYDMTAINETTNARYKADPELVVKKRSG